MIVNNNIQRIYSVGSEWIYYKLYCGTQTANHILVSILHPIITQLLQEKKISKWFFIRYKDPDYHVRIRFLLTDNKNYFEIIKLLNLSLENLIQEHIIWKIQQDTYIREIERYGELFIEFSETLFFCDSEQKIAYHIKEKNLDTEKDVIFAILSIDSFLDLFNLNVEQKTNLLNLLQQSFKLEFSVDKFFSKQCDLYYREIRTKINENKQDKTIKQLLYNKNKLKKINEAITKLPQRNAVNQDFLASHIHMMLNRQFTSNQRMYECIIYDLAYRYYKSKLFSFNNKYV